MKKEDLIKLGLEEDVALKVMEQFSDDLKSFMKKDAYKEANENIKQLKEQLKERDLQLEKLKSYSDSIEDMKKEIEKLQNENRIKDEDYALAIKKMKVETEISNALKRVNAKNEKATKALLDIDIDKIEFEEDGSIKGLGEQIKKLVESEETRFLFDIKDDKLKFKGIEIADGRREVKNEGPDISKMNYEEIAEYLEKNPNIEI